MARRARYLPEGRLLPDDVWRRRHAGLTALLWAHIPVLCTFALLAGHGVQDALAFLALLAVPALVASTGRLSRAVRSGSTAVGLVVGASILVHILHGALEAHFQFFVIIAFLTMYQAWTPFLVAMTFVVAEHGIVGTLYPSAVYGTSGHEHSPWTWALVHGGFVVAAGIANLLSWRITEQEALRDSLTGLPNRVAVIDRLTRELGGRGRVGTAIVFVDLDDFKDANDAYGHHVGDALLTQVAVRLNAVLPADCVLARMGGDEFAVLLEDHEGGARSTRLGERALEALLAAPVRVEGIEIPVRASVGIAVAGPDHESATDLLRNADLAMYDAKRNGKNRVVLYEAAMHAVALRRAALDAELRHALERDEFVLHYQPIVDLVTGHIVATEALVRWQHPARGLVPPGEFIEIAEESGFIVELGTWVLRTACLQTAAWRRSLPGAQDLCASVNLSPRQLGDPALVAAVREALAQSGIEPTAVWLEITESRVVEDFAATLPVLDALRALGPSLSLDDFGTGYSSLSYLRQLPVSTVKIDRSFVRDLGDDSVNAHIVSAVVRLAHALRISVTAEGAETQAHVDALRAMDVQRVQGYFFGKPVDAAAMEARLLAEADSASADPELPCPRSTTSRERVAYGAS